MLFFLLKLFVCVQECDASVCVRFRMSKSHNTKEQKYCICFGVGIVGSCLSGLKDINKENIGTGIRYIVR